MTPNPKSPRERLKVMTRSQLLDSAEALFGEKGFAQTSIDDILESSGVSRATLYAHFTGKEGLLIGVAERMFDAAQQQYDAFAALPDWSHPSIEGWLRDVATDRIRLAPRYRSVLGAARAFLSSPIGLDRLDGLISTVLGHSAGWSHLEPEEAAVRSRMLVILLEQQLYDLVSRDDPADELDAFVRYTANAAVLLRS
ncbi:AcrR family transcriptional regulator [Actinoplanes lutulentus]|nr:TetR/AcrR family transcriptional regulator [Actinoplanes lutulentus]MBB2943328.1 AcrR family transcriptional regulator [Actinoplanes lutulentus]